MTRVVFVDDHTLVRQSLMKSASAEPGFEVVGDTGRGDEAVQVIIDRQPDIVVLDINLPGLDGFGVVEAIRKALPAVRVIFVTMHDDDATIRRAMQAGADGYVPKTASSQEVMLALSSVAAGGSYLSPSVARRVIDFAARGSAQTGDLSQRELEILGLLASGARASDVAERIFLSVKTVKNHLTSIYLKLGVQSAAQAVAEAYRLGLVSAHGTSPRVVSQHR
jgi:DNA-binding NarL/FixJ family response regulator